MVTTKEARSNIQAKIAKARKASPSGTLGKGTSTGVTSRSGGRSSGGSSTPSSSQPSMSTPTGGTQIIVDVATGKSAVVRQTDAAKKLINASRQKAVAQRQATNIAREVQARTISDLRKVGVKDVKLTSEGIVGTRDGRKIVVTPNRQIVKSPFSATINPEFVRRQAQTVRDKSIARSLGISIAQLKKQQAKPKSLEKKIDLTKGEIQPFKPKTLREKLSFAREAQLSKISKTKPEQVGERVFRQTFVLATLGLARGVLGVGEVIRNPIKFAKQQFQALRPKNLRVTLQSVGQQLIIDPVGTVAEFYVFGKTLNLAGKTIKRSPVGRFVNEEVFIRAQPKEIRTSVRKIIKSAKVQEKINPFKIKSIKGVDFAEIKSLTKPEARALVKTLKQSDSVVFGSTAARALSKKKTPIPKDVDIATRNILNFEKKFVNNLPKTLRKGYKLKGEKLIRLSNGEPLFDIKPLNRLLPDRSILTKRGSLPVSGYVKKVSLKKGSILPQIKRKIAVGKLEVPTQKLVKVKGIKLIGFGEQTTRKALGTLQVLIEKNLRRAKDPQSFLISLKIQLETLKKLKPKTPIGKIRIKSKVNKLSDAIKVLQSKQFENLLEKKAPGITKEFPILKKIPVKKLKKIDIPKINKAVKKQLPKILKKKKPLKKTEEIKITKLKKIKRARAKVIKKKVSVLPKTKTSFSRLPPKLRSRLPISKLPSDLTKLPPSKLTSVLSKLPKSRVPSAIRNIASNIKGISSIPKINSILKAISKVPKSRIPSNLISRLASNIPVSSLLRIPPSRLPPSTTKRIKIDFKQRKKLVVKKIEDQTKKKKFVFFPDLAAILYGEKATVQDKQDLLKAGRIFGLERRRLVR